jgi:hypothetical protein
LCVRDLDARSDGQLTVSQGQDPVRAQELHLGCYRTSPGPGCTYGLPGKPLAVVERINGVHAVLGGMNTPELVKKKLFCKHVLHEPLP